MGASEVGTAEVGTADVGTIVGGATVGDPLDVDFEVEVAGACVGGSTVPPAVDGAQEFKSGH